MKAPRPSVVSKTPLAPRARYPSLDAPNDLLSNMLYKKASRRRSLSADGADVRCVYDEHENMHLQESINEGRVSIDSSLFIPQKNSEAIRDAANEEDPIHPTHEGQILSASPDVPTKILPEPAPPTLTNEPTGGKGSGVGEPEVSYSRPLVQDPMLPRAEI